MVLKRALISVTDKTGVVEFGELLTRLGYELLSTGGTANVLRAGGLKCVDVSNFTGFPEMLDGRLKTLHPRIFGGILHIRNNPSHQAQVAQFDLGTIDVVVVNLYAFEQTVAKGADRATCIENIDIGGPSLIRAAAKNASDVVVVVDPKDYQRVGDALLRDDIHAKLRAELQCKAFEYTAAYDAAIAAYMRGSAHLSLSGRAVGELRYGENPHQNASAFATGDATKICLVGAVPLQGKSMSYNNLVDADAALSLAKTLTGVACCAIIKHAMPCGAAVGRSAVESIERAIAADPVSSFGGIVACSAPIDGAAATALSKLFLEVVVAPHFDDEARAVLKAKSNLRLIELGSFSQLPAYENVLRSIHGGLLVSSPDELESVAQWKCVTKSVPSDELIGWGANAMAVAAAARSNAIVLWRDGSVVGIGQGQTNRVQAARLAVESAGERARGAVAASDAFFPFRDGLDVLAESGVALVVQPGGSVRDAEVLAAADEHKVAMVLTGVRHFKH